GVFGQFTLAHAFANGDTSTSGTNPEVGGLYVARLDGVDVIARFGVGIPVAPKTFNGVGANLVTAVARFEDLALIGPESLWLRPGVTVRSGSRDVFAQIELGADIPIKVGDAGTKTVELHGNLGLGTKQGPVALTLEFATVGAD